MTGLKTIIRRHLPDAEVICPIDLHPTGIDYDSAQQRQAFFSLVGTAANVDLLVAYLPQASLGTAIEMWEAYHHGGVVVAITPMRENWVVNLLARAVLPSIEAFESFAADGRLAALLAEPAAGQRGKAGRGAGRMTLDLSRLSGEIRAMGDHLAANRWAVFDRTARARELLATADGPALVAAAEAGRGSVIPVEPPPTRLALGEVPTDYQVLATDGSQIEPDRHGPALCFLINVGWAVIEYGDHASAELASAPELCYRPEDLYVRVGNRQAAIQGSRLEARRTVAEIKRLARLATVPLALPRVAPE